MKNTIAIILLLLPAMAERAISAGNVPIRFWGRIIDQAGQPLAGVNIRSHTRQWHSGAPGQIGSTHPKHNRVSDGDGRFEIDGGVGDALTIDSMQKEGYEVEPGALRSFGFNLSTNVVVSRDQPVVFRMWQKGKHERLVSADKSFHLVPDGRTYTLNVEQGTFIESGDAEGDLRFSIVRPSGVKLGDRYDWTGFIRVVGGGMVEE
jgi:hypothetical protein